METPSCWWSCYYFLNVTASLLLEITFPSYVAWAELNNCKEPTSSGQGLVLNVELALKRRRVDWTVAQSCCYRRGWFMSGLRATSVCMYVTKIMEASTHTCSCLGRCWSTLNRLWAEVFSTVQLILSCWENGRKYVSPVSETEVANGTPFEFRTSSAWESWERIEVFLETEWRKLLQFFVSGCFEMSEKKGGNES